jgi:hypothetical protein
MAFHEKAGRSQVDSFVLSLDKLFFCRAATVATLPSALFRERVLLGASWASGLTGMRWAPRLGFADEATIAKGEDQYVDERVRDKKPPVL